jgi:hypothetical protein
MMRLAYRAFEALIIAAAMVGVPASVAVLVAGFGP